MLDIYKASAGSGKTYTLTLEYIKMLLGKRGENGLYRFYDNISSPHRRILAVTFTNKATDEMKQRIVKQLDLLSHDIAHAPYKKPLCEAFGCSEERLQQIAQTVLYQLLHDFSAFNISTIDSFFQQVLRAFTQEVGLQGGFDVEMDNSFVTATAIDRMLDDLDDSANNDLFEWLMHYAEENIKEGGSWDIYGHNNEKSSDIQQLARKLSSENYKKHRDGLLRKRREDFTAYLKTMRGLCTDYRNTLRTYALQARDAIADTGIDTELFTYSWTKRLDLFANPHAKFTTSDVIQFLKYATDREKWFAKTKIKKSGIDPEAVITAIAAPMASVVDCLGKPYTRYRTAIECSQHLYALGILADIDKYIMEYEQEHNTLLLSKTSEILNGIINQSDAPFIYEKLGTRIEHYLIDEFQDTSRLQWQNFAPLVAESIANGNDNLIVGDVKQSIYRWRNSDWRLLHSAFDSQRNPLFAHHNMDTNWRSCADIVTFNNSFFKTAAHLLQESLTHEISQSLTGDRPEPEIASAYAHLTQKTAPANRDTSGHVAIHFLKKEGSKSEDFYNTVELRIPALLQELFGKGYRMRDIAFLVNTNAEAKRIVEFLLALSAEGTSSLHDLRVISDEALLITNAPPVKLIMGMLRYINRPDTPIYELFLSYEHELMRLAASHGESKALAAYFEQRRQDQRLDTDLQEFIDSIRELPLFEMCEHIINYFSQFGYTRQYVAYIEAFQDIVTDYCRTHNADLHSFIAWWDAKEKRSHDNADSSFTIKSPDDIDAIRVLTIHKSKGLEFPVVIIPYASWQLNRESRTILWCSTRETPFDQMPVLPLTYSSKRLSDTLFARQYFEEKINSHIDSLNLAYVAFTRAIESLTIFAQLPPINKKGESTKSETIGDLIYKVITTPGETPPTDSEETDLSQYFTETEEEACFEMGGDRERPSTSQAETESPLQESTYNITLPGKRMRLRLKSTGITGNDARDYGTLMHNILAEIRYYDDIAPTVRRFVGEGSLPATDEASTVARLQQWLSLPETRQWYAPGITVLTETEILQPQSVFYRPDRVIIDGDRVIIIDYKFGNIERDATYRKQLANYMALVRDMGYRQVDGFLWYLSLEKIVQV